MSFIHTFVLKIFVFVLPGIFMSLREDGVPAPSGGSLGKGSSIAYSGEFLLLTVSACDRIVEYLSGKISDSPDKVPIGIRIKVRENRGCFGLKYALECAYEVRNLEKTLQVVHQGFSFLMIVDPRALMFLIGTEIDYEVTNLSAKFVFHNPNAIGSCGCGESFHV